MVLKGSRAAPKPLDHAEPLRRIPTCPDTFHVALRDPVDRPPEIPAQWGRGARALTGTAGESPPSPDPGAEPGEGPGPRRRPRGPSRGADRKAAFARARVCSEAPRSGPESLPSRPQAVEPSGCRRARGADSFPVLLTRLRPP